MIEQIDDTTFLINKDVLLTEHNEKSYVDATNGNKTPKRIGEYEVIQWGPGNRLPNDLLALANKNHAQPQYLDTVANFIIGNGLGIFEHVVDQDGKQIERQVHNPVISSWLEEHRISEYIEAAAVQWSHFGNIFSLVRYNASGEIGEIKVIDAIYMRCLKADIDGIPGYAYLPDWSKKPNDKDNVLQVFKSYDRHDAKSKEPFILHEKRQTPGQYYYGNSTWWGSQNWIEVSNKIPDFHKAGLTNGYNIKYHISVDQRMWATLSTPAEKDKAKEAFRKNMDTFLSGTENANKALISEFVHDQLGKPTEFIKITPINNSNPDQQYINLDNQANINMSQAHGINPALASIDTGGKLGGSGSELRIAAELHTITRTLTPRKKILAALRLVHKINGWPENQYLAFKDIQFTTLDANPTGKQSVSINQIPGH